MKKSILSLLVVVFVLVGTSCVHHYPYEPDYWFQAIGDDGEYVLTADVERLRNGEGEELIDPSFLSNPVAAKASRISLSLIAKEGTEDLYPLPLSSFITSGAIEGKYSPLIINNSLKFSGSMKVKENGVVRYGWVDELLNIYPYAYCPHYEERVESFDNMILGKSMVGLAMESDTAFVEQNGRIRYIKCNEEARAYLIKNDDGTVVKEQLEVEMLCNDGNN